MTEPKDITSGMDIKGKRKAVIVGINDYNETINDLPSCVRDAESFEALLSKKLDFTEIRKLTDSDASGQAVCEALDWLFEGVNENDRLVFYYSGHGATSPNPSNGMMEEFLVLSNGAFLQDDAISSRTQNLPDGVFTMVLDSCFSAGMDKRLFECVEQPLTGIFPSLMAEPVSKVRSKVKSYFPSRQELKALVANEDFATVFRPFLQNPRVIAAGASAKLVNPPSDETGQMQMKGMLLAACSERETATASTAVTNGMSAYTFCLLNAISKLGASASTNALIRETEKTLHLYGFKQTPVIQEPKALFGLAAKPFLNLPTALGVTVKEQPELGPALLQMLVDRLTGGSAKILPGGCVWPTESVFEQLRNLTSVPADKSLGSLLPIILPPIIEALTKGKSEQQKSLADELVRLGVTPRIGGDDQSWLMDLINKRNTEQAKGVSAEKWIDVVLPIILPPIIDALTKGKSPQPKLFGIDDALLIPAAASVIAAAINRQKSAETSKDILNRFNPTPYDPVQLIQELLKSQQGNGETSGNGSRSGGRSIGSAQQETPQKFLGIDDAVLTTVLVSALGAALKGQPVS